MLTASPSVASFCHLLLDFLQGVRSQMENECNERISNKTGSKMSVLLIL